jgi:hypothetical protein
VLQRARLRRRLDICECALEVDYDLTEQAADPDGNGIFVGIQGALSTCPTADSLLVREGATDAVLGPVLRFTSAGFP